MSELDQLLYEALSPTETPSEELNRKIYLRAKKEQTMKNKNTDLRRFPLAAAIAVAVIAASSVTVYAAWHFCPRRRSRRSLAMRGCPRRSRERM